MIDFNREDQWHTVDGLIDGQIAASHGPSRSYVVDAVESGKDLGLLLGKRGLSEKAGQDKGRRSFDR
ncbi:MAG: hypothetical protein HC850_00440 [Rhodomicrobium sp.]|nr:hypothetical protein [Rhodomicrobium sp.]